MKWIEDLELCAIGLLYAAHDCPDGRVARVLRLLAGFIGGLVEEAKAKA